MTNTTCLFCGQEAKGFDPDVTEGYDILLCEYDCSQCGPYKIDEDVEDRLRKAGGDTCFRIACVLNEKRLRGVTGTVWVLQEETAQMPEGAGPKWRASELVKEFPKPTELMDRSLMNLSCYINTERRDPLDTMSVSLEQLRFPFFSSTRESALRMLNYLRDSGRIAHRNSTRDVYHLTITPDGWKRIEELSRTPKESRQAFVAMWISNETDEFWTKGIYLAVRDAKYDPKRIDMEEHNEKICDEIIAEIRRSRFVVADFTAGRCDHCDGCNDEETCTVQVRPRGGVYFEAGFALGLGIPVIWTVRKDQIDQVHFDTRQYNHIVYETPEELRLKLANRIRATIT